MALTMTLEQLVQLGGLFYEMAGEYWCDLPTSSYKLNTKTGLYEIYED